MPALRIFRKMQELLDVDASAIGDGKVPVWRTANGKHAYEVPPPGPQGPAGPTGPTGATGPGVAAGGTAGQVLTKIDATNFNTNWQTPTGGGGPDPLKVDKDSVVVAATRIVASKLLAGDAQPAVQIFGDGKLKWGPGGAGITDTDLFRVSNGVLGTSVHFQALASITAYQGTVNQVALGNPAAGISFGNAGDTSMYRQGAGVLKTDGRMVAADASYGYLANPAAAGGYAFASFIGADSQPRFRVTASDGRIDWGVGGSTAPDVSLYRGAVNTLSVAPNLRVDGYLDVAFSDTGQLRFGSALDTNLYRAAADRLRTDDVLQSMLGIQYNPGNATQVAIGTVGGNAGIEFGSAGDTNLFRRAASALQSNGSLWLSPATNITAFYASLSSDSQPRLTIGADGKHDWGPGGSGVTDTNLYRFAGGTLATDGRFACQFVSLATLKSLDVGAPDSGGAGFRMVRVPN